MVQKKKSRQADGAASAVSAAQRQRLWDAIYHALESGAAVQALKLSNSAIKQLGPDPKSRALRCFAMWKVGRKGLQVDALKEADDLLNLALSRDEPIGYDCATALALTFNAALQFEKALILLQHEAKGVQFSANPSPPDVFMSLEECAQAAVRACDFSALQKTAMSLSSLTSSRSKYMLWAAGSLVFDVVTDESASSSSSPEKSAKNFNTLKIAKKMLDKLTNYEVPKDCGEKLSAEEMRNLSEPPVYTRYNFLILKVSLLRKLGDFKEALALVERSRCLFLNADEPEALKNQLLFDQWKARVEKTSSSPNIETVEMANATTKSFLECCEVVLSAETAAAADDTTVLSLRASGLSALMCGFLLLSELSREDAADVLAKCSQCLSSSRGPAPADEESHPLLSVAGGICKLTKSDLVGGGLAVSSDVLLSVRWMLHLEFLLQAAAYRRDTPAATLSDVADLWEETQGEERDSGDRTKQVEEFAEVTARYFVETAHCSTAPYESRLVIACMSPLARWRCSQTLSKTYLEMQASPFAAASPSRRRRGEGQPWWSVTRIINIHRTLLLLGRNDDDSDCSSRERVRKHFSEAKFLLQLRSSAGRLPVAVEDNLLTLVVEHLLSIEKILSQHVSGIPPTPDFGEIDFLPPIGEAREFSVHESVKHRQFLCEAIDHLEEFLSRWEGPNDLPSACICNLIVLLGSIGATLRAKQLFEMLAVKSMQNESVAPLLSRSLVAFGDLDGARYLIAENVEFSRKFRRHLADSMATAFCKSNCFAKVAEFANTLAQVTSAPVANLSFVEDLITESVIPFIPPASPTDTAASPPSAGTSAALTELNGVSEIVPLIQNDFARILKTSSSFSSSQASSEKATATSSGETIQVLPFSDTFCHVVGLTVPDVFADRREALLCPRSPLAFSFLASPEAHRSLCYPCVLIDWNVGDHSAAEADAPRVAAPARALPQLYGKQLANVRNKTFCISRYFSIFFGVSRCTTIMTRASVAKHTGELAYDCESGQALSACLSAVEETADEVTSSAVNMIDVLKVIEPGFRDPHEDALWDFGFRAAHCPPRHDSILDVWRKQSWNLTLLCTEAMRMIVKTSLQLSAIGLTSVPETCGGGVPDVLTDVKLKEAEFVFSSITSGAEELAHSLSWCMTGSGKSEISEKCFDPTLHTSLDKTTLALAGAAHFLSFPMKALTVCLACATASRPSEKKKRLESELGTRLSKAITDCGERCVAVADCLASALRRLATAAADEQAMLASQTVQEYVSKSNKENAGRLSAAFGVVRNKLNGLAESRRR